MAVLVSTLGVIGCGDGSGGHSDPNVFCNEGLCLQSETLKAQCVNVFNACIAENPDVNDDECVAAALLICESI